MRSDGVSVKPGYRRVNCQREADAFDRIGAHQPVYLTDRTGGTEDTL
jgi:hypothetical protein